MANDDMYPEPLEADSAPARPEMLVSSVLHLMSHYSAASQEANCAGLAPAIERHLKALAELSDLAPVLRATCRQLSEHWASVVAQSMPRPERSSLFARLVAGAGRNTGKPFELDQFL
ncbi:hypothetical protein D3870_14835 [Noviherbaspirillum cavernae]|uniref:Uncharacterized protein n=1 Tax=Noviherbaspirillum cavernae TaxID=2320862 RepID=A0A418X6L8_9BURK|nr:hypothetical protein [Noviherbaspirillum cavernae]RJG08100.1 hypothetical protein D3870_14835 [Noviherbaspirillum cavernae]